MFDSKAPLYPVLRRALFVSATGAMTLLAGCANMVFTAPAGTASTPAATINGNVHGGQQPVGASTVRLYSTGTTGYGKGATLLATTTSGVDGSFSFTKSGTNSDTVDGTTNAYACPTTGDPQIYITSVGGNSQAPSSVDDGTNTTVTTYDNPAIGLLVAIGACSTISSSTPVQINEITSVASIYAIQQYLYPGSGAGTEVVGTSSSAQGTVGLNNAVAGISNLAVMSQGVPAQQIRYDANGYTMTVTSESNKLIHLANIVAACINSTNGTKTVTVTPDATGVPNTPTVTTSSSNNCLDLLNASIPPAPAVTSQPTVTFATAADTIQAVYYIATNPTNAGTFYAACHDGGTTNISCLYDLAASLPPFQTGLSAQPTDWTLGVNFKSTSACTTGTFIDYPYALEADAAGNIWVLSGGDATTNVSNLSELSPSGVPTTCVLGSTVQTGRGLSIDIAGYVWVSGNGAGGIQKYNPATGTATAFTEGGNTPYTLVADGSGNIFYSVVASKTVRKLPGATAAASVSAITPVAIGGATTTTPYFMAADQAGRVWVTDTNTSGNLFNFYPVATGGTNGYSSVTTVDTTNTYNDYGIAIDAANKVWVGNSNSKNSVGIVTPTSISTEMRTSTAAFLGGVSSPRGVAIDGAGNVWLPNGVATPTGGGYSVTELTNGAAALSPTSGTTVATDNGGFQKPTSVFANTLRGITIDPSGNVWVGSNSSSGTSVAEIVGAAVPVVTPLSAQLTGTTPTGPVKP